MGRFDEYDDERVVVIDRDKGTSGVGTFLLGLAIGAGAALLFAPASGADTRRRLSDEAKRAGRRMKDATDEFGEDMAEKVEHTRAQFDEKVAYAREAVSSRMHAVGDAVSVGREAAAQARADLERAVADTKRAYADSRRASREQSHRDAPHDGAATAGEAPAGAPSES